MQYKATTAVFSLFLMTFSAARAADATLPAPLQSLDPYPSQFKVDTAVPVGWVPSPVPVADTTAPQDQEQRTPTAPRPSDAPEIPGESVATDMQSQREPWLDRTQERLHKIVSGSSKRVDSWFGADDIDPGAYDRASGSIAPALLWDEFDGFKPRMRFRANFPLPHINERFDAFIGRVNRDEYVTERAQESGAFRRQYGPVEDDQTLLGISYRENPKPGGRWDAGAGVRVRFPLDPYVKGSYMYRLGNLDRISFTIRETAFWQNSENLGLTNRIDFERLLFDQWLVRWTSSATVSQETDGMRGYSAISAMRGFPSRRAVTFEVGLDGETEADVPLHDYGFKAAYRQSVMRNYLVMEVRTSLRWPREKIEEHREASWGVGVGFEMFFGTDEFLARPVTF